MRWNEFGASASQEAKDRVGEIFYRFMSAGLRRYGVFRADAHQET